MPITPNSARAVYGLRASADPSKTQVSGGLSIGVEATTLPLTGATKAYCVSATLASASDTLTIDTETGIATIGTAPVAQVETATVVAVAGATSNGNLAVTVTGARITGSPLAVSVPLTTAANTAALVAAQVRARFNATAAISSKYTVGGTGANVTLTEIDPQNNDATLNIAIAAGLGVSAITTSTDTTAGVGGVKLTNNTGDGNDFEGVALVSGTDAIQGYYGFLIKSVSGFMSAVYDTTVFTHSIPSGSVVSAIHPNSIDASSTGLVITALGNDCEVEITFICA
jgi:hypothetical protein